MKQVVWFHRAVSSLEHIADYIAQDNPQAAYKVIQKIRKTGDSLTQHPELGRVGRVNGTRGLVVPGLPDVLPYYVKGDSIIILHVLHTARKWPDFAPTSGSIPEPTLPFGSHRPEASKCVETFCISPISNARTAYFLIDHQVI